MMSNDLDLGENSVKNLFTMIDDKLHVTVEFGCFYVDLKLQVKGLNKVTRKFLEMAEENFGDSEYWKSIFYNSYIYNKKNIVKF